MRRSEQRASQGSTSRGGGDELAGGPGLYALGPGDEVAFTVGREGFTPVKFHTFEVGPFTVTTKVREGETGAEAVARARVAAQAIFDAEYKRKLDAYLDHVREASETAVARSGRGRG